MGKRLIRLNEQRLNRIIKESVKRVLNEKILGQGESFTPYTPEEREQNFAPYNGHVTGDMYSRNPSYEKAKKAAQERMAARRAANSVNEENKSGIHIDPKNKGKFTKTMKDTGKSASELKNSPNPLTRKRANFALMAKRGWKPLKKSEKKEK